MVFAALSTAALGQAPIPADRPWTVCFYPPIPERYDYVPDFPVRFVSTDPKGIAKFCTDPTFYACAFPQWGKVVMLEESYLYAAGLRQSEIDCLKRHEIAHLNGWGAGHEP